MSYTGSFKSNVTSDLTDRFMQCQSGVAVRKFDDTLWPSGSWHEVWIAFALRLNLLYPWRSPNSDYVDPGSGQFMIGLCVTSGSVFGENSGSRPITNQHLLGMYFYNNSSNPPTAGRTDALYTGSYAYTAYSAFPRMYATGSKQGTFAFSNLAIPFTSGSEERTMFSMRIFRTLFSSTPTSCM